jgi:uncharacterized protein (DUF111 family)
VRLAYLDCSGGISAATLLASLLSAGGDPSAVRTAVGTLDLPALELQMDEVNAGSVVAIRVTVTSEERIATRRLGDVERILRSGRLGNSASRLSVEVYRRLARAEARIHGTTTEAVVFHEVGQVEPIVCVAGVAVAMETLLVQRVVASPISTGRGSVRTSHGILRIPAPATAELLHGLPSIVGGTEGELTTPTGAALVASLARDVGPEPRMTRLAAGYGATTLAGGATRLTRVVLGEILRS